MSATLPTLIAVLAAFCFALAAHVQNIGLSTENTRIGTLVVVGATAGFYWLVAPFIVSPAYWLTGATILFVCAGLVRPTLTMVLWVEGIKRLGPTLNAGISASGPIFSATFAVLVLGEIMTWPIAIGTAAVITGVLVAALRRSGSTVHFPAWALLLPLSAAFFRAGAHAVTKIGFAEVPSPFFASLVGITVGFGLLLVRFRWQGHKIDIRGRGIKFFVAAGAINAVAVYLLNQALELGQLITVAPVLSISPVFAMLLGLFVFGRETLTWRTFATIALVVPGVLLITLYS
jgi:drug/metabolite transporter, DME family